LPVVGNLLEFRRDPLGFLTRCARDYGDVARYRVAHHIVYLLNRPDLIEQMLVVDHVNFMKGGVLRAGRALLGNGLLTTEGDEWRRQRRLVQPAFHRERVAAYSDVIVEYAQRMLAMWRDGETRDIHHEMIRLALPIITHTLFDVRVDDEADRAGAAMHDFLEEFKQRMGMGALIPAWLPTPARQRSRRAIVRLEAMVDRMVNERRASGLDRGDLLSMLLRARDDDGSPLTDRQLRDQVMTLFLAGHETTAVTLTWTWFLLAQSPQVEARLLEELRSVLNGRWPSAADVPRLTYTEKVIKESLRLYPPVWAITRVAVRDGEIGGYPVSAGMSVAMSQWVTHRDPRYFDRPEAFDPDRWTDELTKRLPKFAYFPFGGGPRVCVGAALAMMEAVLLLAAIAPRFHLSLVPNERVELWPSLTLHPKRGLPMRLSARG
jgi:cytochrome P450